MSTNTKTVEQFAPQPIRCKTQTVLPEWIDFNGHMNVAYYTLAIDRSLDDVFDMLGLGEELVRDHNMGPMAMQAQIHYLDELLEGQDFVCDFQLLDQDHKRLHYFVTMHHLEKGTIAATWEAVSMNVDLGARRSAPYPEACLRRVERLMAAHAELPRPDLVGAALGLRRKR